ncbi:hypothetical protein V8B97DRAFT_718024 [Scleroderma yunnanense]
MPSLSDHIERLTTTARAIRASAAAIIPSEDNPSAQTGPFTRAVLDTALGDLIRDIDASELGLFTLVSPPSTDIRKQPENGPRKGEITRVGFPGATPLRKMPTRRDEMMKPKEFEPEVYARAALKYLDRYQSIRPMPRARAQVIALIGQLDEIRANINHLNETIQELTSLGLATAPETQISSVAEEEERINGLQNRLAELRIQKESLLQANDLKPRTKPLTCPKSKLPHPQLSDSEADPQEDAFWFTPATPARTLRFTDKLMDEEVDFGEVSTISFDSPGPAAPRSVFASLATGKSPDNEDLADVTTPDDSIFGLGVQRDDVSNEKSQDAFDGEGEEHVSSQLDVSEDEEQTVVLKKFAPTPPPQLPDDPSSQPASGAYSGSSDPPVEVQFANEPAPKAPKVRVTPELERIVAKIWCTVGDIIMPGSSYSNDVKPPRAKETLAHIQLLATQSPSPQSPTTSSHSSFLTSTSASATSGVVTGPTPHQINTAQLLHALLTAPNHAMQLNKLKEAIGGTRALYACVAKKLVRIDRGGGEQIVLFDL